MSLLPVCGCGRTWTINKSFASACHNPTKVPSPLVPSARGRTRGLLPCREQSSKSNSCIISTAIKAKRAFYARKPRVVERGKSEQDGYPQRALPLSLSCSCSRSRVCECAAGVGAVPELESGSLLCFSRERRFVLAAHPNHGVAAQGGK